MIYLILFVTILGVLLFKLFDILNKQFRVTPVSTSSLSSSNDPGYINPILPRKTDVTEIYKDISIEPYGCFSSVDEKFFLKEINKYSNKNVFDSGIIISESRRSDDMKELIQQVINNGFDQYGYSMLHKYNNDPDGYSKNMNIKEIGVLGKLAGYNYISVFKIDEHTRGKIYLTYSPPMDDENKKHVAVSDVPGFTLTPKLNNYTNEEEKAPGKEMACGYPCLPYDKPMTFDDNGVTRQYMCGSVAYPDIKSPTRFAVYRIVEKI
uniref:Uncharacterized protein n=1 Tax=viral metagenome TaxID=1070528 RepID=A0A6C0B0N7_9ZZZZ